METEYDLKCALIDWAFATGSIYLTDNDDDACGVVAGEEGVLHIRNEEDGKAVYYKGNCNEYLELLKENLFKIEGESVKLYVDQDNFFTKFVG